MSGRCLLLMGVLSKLGCHDTQKQTASNIINNQAKLTYTWKKVREHFQLLEKV